MKTADEYLKDKLTEQMRSIPFSEKTVTMLMEAYAMYYHRKKTYQNSKD
jgi:hypothetical protein